MDLSINVLATLIKRRLASEQQRSAVVCALDDLRAKVRTQGSAEVTPAALSSLLACMRTTDSTNIQAVLCAVAALADGAAEMHGMHLAWHHAPAARLFARHGHMHACCLSCAASTHRADAMQAPSSLHTVAWADTLETNKKLCYTYSA